MTSPLPTPRLREWAPSSHIILHGPQVYSIFSFSPMVIATNPDVSYFCEARVFGKDPLRPIAKFVQEDVALTGSWTLTSEEVAARCGLDTLQNYIEFHSGSRTFDPLDDFIFCKFTGITLRRAAAWKDTSRRDTFTGVRGTPGAAAITTRTFRECASIASSGPSH